MKNSISILYALLSAGKEIRYRNKLQGYGLNESDFNKIGKGISRKIFRSRCNNFLKIKYIEKLQSKDKKSNYYSITPLGIAWLFQQKPLTISNEAKSIFRILLLMRKKYEKEYDIILEPPDIDDSVLSRLKPAFGRQFFKELQNACKTIRIQESYNNSVITLVLPFSFRLQYQFDQFVIYFDKKILWIFGTQSDKIIKKNMSEIGLQTSISLHILRVFILYLVKLMKNASNQTSAERLFTKEIVAAANWVLLELNELSATDEVALRDLYQYITKLEKL